MRDGVSRSEAVGANIIDSSDLKSLIVVLTAV